MKIYFFVFILFFSVSIFSQIQNVQDALVQIEKGNFNEATETLNKLKIQNQNDPSIKFLDAVLTRNAKDAIIKFEDYYKKNPNGKFADASLFRIFSYYYALGFYKKADTLLTELKTKFPNSTYLKTVDKSISDFEDDEPFKKEPTTQTKPEIVTNKLENINYSIQVAAFINPENAQKLLEQLRKDSYKTEIITKEIGGSNFKIVIVGDFSSESEAKKVLDEINKKFNVNGRILIK